MIGRPLPVAGRSGRALGDTRVVEAFGFVVIGVLAIGVIAGLIVLRKPVRWDELGGASPLPDPEAVTPSRLDDESDLRALVAAKRAARQAAGGAPVASDAIRAEAKALASERRAAGAAWAHLEAEVVEEARALVARRRARLERTGKPVPAEQDELIRLLGPPRG